MALLKLLALDEVDLSIISAHIQSATTAVKHMIWEPRNHRFVLAVERMAWEDMLSRPMASMRRQKGAHYQTVLRFDRIMKVTKTGIDLHNPEQSLTLLAIIFHPEDAPGGAIELIFDNNAAIRLEAECIEAALTDVAPLPEVAHKDN